MACEGPKKRSKCLCKLRFLCGRTKKKIPPHSVKPVTTELRLQIPKGCYSKIYPRSNFVCYNFVTVDGRVIDSDYHRIVIILMINHSDEEFMVDIKEKVEQNVLQKTRKSLLQKFLS